MSDARTILFGGDSTEGITAVEVGETQATMYLRTGGEVVRETAPFSPWMLVSREDDAPAGSSVAKLEGDGFRFLVSFPNRGAFIAARNAFRAKGTDHLAYPSFERQFLLASGRTLFKGLAYGDARRMQVDIETAGLSSEPESSRILLIALSDNTGYEEIVEGEEAEMLARYVAIVRERDPDIIEGHNVFGFDLPFLAARARRCGVGLKMGRDDSEMAFAPERSCPVGGYSRPFTPAIVRGRHVIDTLLAVQRFDVGRGRLERHNLKECARTLGLAEPDRIVIPGDQILGLWESDPETVKEYARHDIRETRRLAELVCPAEYYLTQMIPDTYQAVATSGTGEKINAILVREYLRRGRAIPKPQAARSVPGGYTEVRRCGLIRNVVKCDVESLYPSLMLSMGIKPASDTLGVFLPALAELTSRRMDAKSKAKIGPACERAYWDGVQNSFKILINSFYGYLGAPFNFNDYDAAEKVTTSGQAIVKQIAESIERRGGSVIEIDTDGVYFESPPDVRDETAEIALVEQVSRELPEGINLAHDGRYEAMISLKIKNYVLIEHGGRKVFRGSSLRSRADEPYGREFISQAVDLLIEGDSAGVGKLYEQLLDDIRNGRLPVEQFARRERVTSKTFNSSQKKRMAAVAQGTPLGDYVTIYERNDGEIGLIENYAGDENRDYLADKLYKFACRLREAFGEEFDLLFPRPGSRLSAAREAEAAGQQTLDLF